MCFSTASTRLAGAFSTSSRWPCCAYFQPKSYKWMTCLRSNNSYSYRSISKTSTEMGMVARKQSNYLSPKRLVMSHKVRKMIWRLSNSSSHISSSQGPFSAPLAVCSGRLGRAAPTPPKSPMSSFKSWWVAIQFSSYWLGRTLGSASLESVRTCGLRSYLIPSLSSSWTTTMSTSSRICVLSKAKTPSLMTHKITWVIKTSNSSSLLVLDTKKR